MVKGAIMREHGKVWNSLIARSDAYSEAADKLVELGVYNKHIEQEVCALLLRLGGDVELTQEELDAVHDMSFDVTIMEDEEGNIKSKHIKVKP